MGSFSVMPLQDLVEFLARRRASGSLTCERGTIHKTVHLVEGVAVAAASNDPREHLGQLLLNFGHITEEQLEKAFETQEETKIRLGRVLTMVGVLAPEVVRETLAIKIRETLLDVFVWDAGHFVVDDAAVPPEVDELEAQVPLADIAREAEFRTTAWQAFRAQFPTGTATLVVDDARVPAGLVPGSVDDRLLSLARDGKTIDELALALHATDFHLYQRLYALQRQGVLEAAPARAAAAPAAEAAEPPDVVARLRDELLDPPRTPRLKVKSRDVALMRLTAAEKYLLGRCDGTRDLRQILQVAPLGEGEVLRAVKKFLEGRILELT